MLRFQYPYLWGFLALILGTTYIAQGQAIQTTIGNVSNACVGDTVSVPVTVTMGSGISATAISLAVDYDTTKLRCLNSTSNINPAIATGFLSNCGFFTNQSPNPPYSATSRRQFRVAWFNLVPVAFNGLMFNMRFVVLSPGNSSLQWDLATAGNCEYADEFADAIAIPASGWISGVVNTPQVLGNLNLFAGANSTLSVSAPAGSTFQWQTLNSGGVWVNLSNSATIGGVVSSTLTFTNVDMSLHGSRYRVLVNTGRCNIFSNVVQLMVREGVSISQMGTCLGDTVVVPIHNSLIGGVANAFLTLQYNPDSLVYLGYSNLNPVLNGMSVSGVGGNVIMNWNVASNQTIPSGTLIGLRFRVNGSSNLVWDTVVTPCEFNDQNLNVVPKTYYSGSVTHNTKRFTWNRNICEGQSFALGGQAYTSSGTYQGRRFGTGGACDTLITLNLTVIPRQTILPSVTRCSNQPYSFNGLSLTSSGTYYDTLINSLGCDSILRLNLVVHPSYQQSQSVIVCSGTTFAFGGQNLTTSGNYSHTYTTANGCDSLVNLTLTIAGGGNQVAIQASSAANGFCPGGGVRIGLANPYPSAGYRWKRDGNLVAGANADTLLVTQAGDYQLEVEVSPTCTLVSNTLTIVVLNCNRITGDLRYDNAGLTPMSGVPVLLKTMLGNVVASDTTDSLGAYDMAGYANGNYLLDASVNYAWGGVTSADALLVTRAFNALILLSPLRLKAGDANANNIANSADALLINRRITGLLASFSAGSFVNNLPAVNAVGNPLQTNLRVLSTGDVNGTYSALPAAPALVLDTVIGGFGSGTATVRFTTSGSGVFERGLCWSTTPNPTTGSNKWIAGSGGYGFVAVFSGNLVGNQMHYIRAYARTSQGTYYSNEKTFIAPPGQPCSGVSTVTDVDGNVYQGVQIGTQCWTQSNLKVSKYRNGDAIPTGLSNSAWQGTTAGAYAIYNNDPANDALYGKLYNHYAVTDSRGLCPTGWHVPTDGEWTTLETFLGGSGVAGGALKSTATQPTPGGWTSPNTGATNSSGFFAPPGGLRFNYGFFDGMSNDGFWWSSSVSSASGAWNRYLNSNYSNLFRLNPSRSNGFSVRCCRD